MLKQPGILHHGLCSFFKKKKDACQNKLNSSQFNSQKTDKTFDVDIFLFLFFFSFLNAKVYYIHLYALCKSTSVMFVHVSIISEALCQISSVISVKTESGFVFLPEQTTDSVSHLSSGPDQYLVRIGHGHCPAPYERSCLNMEPFLFSSFMEAAVAA